MGRFTDYLLGGSANAIVGDGYGVVTNPGSSRSPILPQPVSIDIRPSSSKLSISQSLSPLIPHGSFESVNSSTSSLRKRGHTPLRSPSTHAVDGPSFSTSQHCSRKPVAVKFDESPDGVRATKPSARFPLAPTAPTRTLEKSPPPSTTSFHSTIQQPAQVETSQRVEELPWESYEIPEELGLMKDETPREISDIIQESLDEHWATRASRMQTPAIEEFIPHTTAVTINTKNSPMVAERSASALMRSTSTWSTSSSESITDSSCSSLGSFQGSQTTLESENSPNGFFKLPPTAIMVSSVGTSQGRLGSEKLYDVSTRSALTELAEKSQESKIRTAKGYKMFRSLPHRRIRDKPTQTLLLPEQAVSECISCFDDIPNKKAVNMPCGHKYCSGCFSQLVSTAILSQDTYPPKCCLSEVPVKTIRQHLPLKDMVKYDEKVLEYAVPVANRYYCAVPQCAKWIDTRMAKRRNGVLECPHCRKCLCTVCRGPQHPSNEDCPQDFGLDRTLKQAERAGWRRCYNCRAIVELNTGCRHITCKCKAEFCYTCGLRWRTCVCTEADQARRELQLRERQTQFEAEQRAEDEEERATVAAVEQAERAIQREREAEQIRVQEEAHEIERLEQERLSDIGDYYQSLRSVLERARTYQRQAIEQRHERAWQEIDRIHNKLQSPENLKERERAANAERESIMCHNDGKIRNLQGKHAIIMKDIIAHHREAERNLMEIPLDDLEVNAELMRLETYEQLMQTQKLERQRLKSQQVHEVQDWKSRCEQDLIEFDRSKLILPDHHICLEEITKLQRELKTRVVAEGKWFDVLFSQRITMLSEDETRMIRSGAEAPRAPNPSRPFILENESALPAPKLAAHRPSGGEPTAGISREQLSFSMRPKAYHDLHVGVNRSGRVFQPQWEEDYHLQNSCLRGMDKISGNWKRPGLGSTIRVG